MTDIAPRPGGDPGGDPDTADPSGRLAAYQGRTQTALDLLALVSLWFVVVPPGDYAPDVRGIAWALRIALSVVYGIDLAIRGILAGHPVRYALANPLALASVLLPPVRVIFSIRLARSMFLRGHLGRFLLAAAVLVLNGAVIVYLAERHAPGSNIHTLGQSLWWSLVTVTTSATGTSTRSPHPGGSPRASSWSPACSLWPLSPPRWHRASSRRGPGEPRAARSRRRPRPR